MAERKEPAKEESEGISLDLRAPEALARPQFANYVLSNLSKMGHDTIATLTFVHVYPIPTGPAGSRPEGEVVARVSLSDRTAIALRDLLIRQHPFTATQLKALRPGTQKRTRQK